MPRADYAVILATGLSVCLKNHASGLRAFLPAPIECIRHQIAIPAAAPCLLCVFESNGAPQVRSVQQIMLGATP